MKKMICYIMITAMLVPMLFGCGADVKETNPMDNINLDDALDALAVAELAGKDNSLDAYSALVNSPLQVEEPTDAIEGGGSGVFLGTARAYSFKKHLLGSAEESWDELAFVTDGEQKGSEHFGWENRIWDVGPVVGTDHYVTLNDESSRYFLTERDENHQKIREIPLKFLDGVGIQAVINDLSGFAVDSSGVVHLVRNTSEGWRYQLLSSEGEIMAEYNLADGDIQGLVPLYDGRIAFLTYLPAQKQNILQYLDEETGEAVKLATPEVEAYFYTLFDEDKLLYADKNGIYRSDLFGQDPELLYLWQNHGLKVHEVLAMQTGEDGRIQLIYRDSESDNYLCLEPTTEEVEISEITLAVSSYNISYFQSMVVEFNKKYPSCHINIKSNYDETALMTELTAGGGPVLVDSALTGFTEQEKLWQPLDSVLEQLGLAEELLPDVLEVGKINGTQYGIVTNFSLNTLITADPSLENWDYEAFLQSIEDRPELEAIYNNYGEGAGSLFFTHVLSHGFNDTYLWDAETGTTNFDSEGFRKALEMANKYVEQKEMIYLGEGLVDGKTLCNEVNILRPEQIAMYRIWFGEKAHFIGYPTKDGAAHFIEADYPLTIRRSASEKEKVIAYAFLKLCLSYEGQSQATKDFNFNLSVRKDVLEEQFATMNENQVFVMGKDEQLIRLGDDMNIEQDWETLLALIDQARPYEYFQRELLDLLWEELDQYFTGTITEDMLINHLESRVGLYLKERE